jgi:uncharacterized membrane protein YbaN (DUF454 family)
MPLLNWLAITIFVLTLLATSVKSNEDHSEKFHEDLTYNRITQRWLSYSVSLAPTGSQHPHL